MLVFRIEDPASGHGPYVVDLSIPSPQAALSYHITKLHNSNMNTPPPAYDNIGFIYRGEYCGFASTKQLRSWFGGQNLGAKLSKAGYVIAIYRVDPNLVRHGRKQLVFQRADLEPVRRLDPSVLA